MLPLSPARQCARSYSFGMGAPFANRDVRSCTRARSISVDTMPICSLTYLRAPPPPAGPLVYSASTSSPTIAASSRDARARRPRAAHLVGTLVGVERAAVQRRAADEVDAQLGEPAVQPLANDLAGEPRARDRVGARVADLAFADVAGEIADADLELVGRARPRAPRTAMRSGPVSVSVTREKSAITSGVR